MEKTIEIKVGDLPITDNEFKNFTTDTIIALCNINKAYCESLSCVVNMDYIIHQTDISFEEKYDKIKEEVTKSYGFQEEAKEYVNFL